MSDIALPDRWRPAVVQGVVFVAALLVVLYLDATQARVTEGVRDQQLRALSEEALVAFSGEIEQRLRIVTDLGAFTRVGPVFAAENFEEIAESMLQGVPGVLSLQLAPHGIVEHVTDPERNAAVLGRDLLRSPADSSVALGSIRSERVVLQGPVTLAQGGVGVIARYPIFLDVPSRYVPLTRRADLRGLGVPGERADRFWGFSTIVFELDTIVAAIGGRLSAEGASLSIASQPSAGEGVTIGPPPPAEALTVSFPIKLASQQEWRATFAFDADASGSLFFWRPRLWALGFVFAAIVAWSVGWLFRRKAELASQVARATRDLEDQVRLADDALRSAQAAIEAKAAFLRGMSHEFRTPLNAIIGYSELLLEDTTEPLTGAQTRRLRHVNASGGEMLEFVDKLLALAQGDQMENVRAPEPVDLVRVVADCSEVLGPRCAARSVVIRTVIDESGDMRVLAHAVTVHGVLMNLISNATRYSPEHAEVVVEVRGRIGHRVRIEVTNQGPGLSPEDWQAAFAPGRAAGTTEPLTEPGSLERLSLFASRELVRRMGGDLGVRSAVETEEVIFWVELPRWEPEPVEQSGSENARSFRQEY